MARIHGQVEIAAPIEDVFDMVADGRNEPKYNPRMARVVKLTEGPMGAGARFRAEPRGMGAKAAVTVEVIEYERPRRLRSLVRSRYMHGAGRLSFEASGGGTRFGWDWDMALVGALRPLSPLFTLVGPGWERRTQAGLKRYMESGGR